MKMQQTIDFLSSTQVYVPILEVAFKCIDIAHCVAYTILEVIHNVNH